MSRTLSDSDLLAYSGEHVKYEVWMFFSLARLLGDGQIKIMAPSDADVRLLYNALIEAFVLHLRNLKDFIYEDEDKRWETDIVAADFFPPGEWIRLRGDITPVLKKAGKRADQEIAHLTTARIAGGPSGKIWDFSGLAKEIRPLLHLMVDNALPSRLSPKVALALGI